MQRTRGITLLEVTIALVTLTLGFTALLRIWIAFADQVGAGRRWTLMAAAASSEMERLERSYRAAAPACVVPASGSGYTPDGVGLDWRTADSLGQLVVRLEVRAAAGRRTLLDSLTGVVSCR
jgi:Tfp pilus assembly protein PilV